MFNITSKYFNIFDNAPPASWVAHIARDFLKCYFCSYYISMEIPLLIYRIVSPKKTKKVLRKKKIRKRISWNLPMLFLFSFSFGKNSCFVLVLVTVANKLSIFISYLSLSNGVELISIISQHVGSGWFEECFWSLM